MYRIRTHAPRAAIAIALAAAIALAGALLPGLPGADPADPPPAYATTGHSIVPSITSAAGADGVYTTGETITVRVRFDQCVTVRSNAALTITMDSGAVTANPPASHTNSQDLDFSYTILAADYAYGGVSVATTALAGTYTLRATCTTGGTHQHTSPAITNALASAQSAHTVNNIDYDTDDDGLIDITSEAQLVAIQADDNGDGAPVLLGWIPGDEVAAYETAFPGRKKGTPGRNGCYRAGPPVNTACIGYELMNDLNFDTNDDGQVNNDDDFPNVRPIGIQDQRGYSAIFEGNGHTISNYRQHTAVQQAYAGLFAELTGGIVRNVGMANVDISNHLNPAYVGALAGNVRGGSGVRNCWVTGTVSATRDGTSQMRIGGLVGRSTQPIINSWSSATVTLESTLRNDSSAGGLVGIAAGGNIIASYATGAVTGGGASGGDRSNIGGLAGYQSGGWIIASYSTGAVSSTTANRAGGLVGRQTGGSISASYSTGTVANAAGGDLGGLVGLSSGGAIHNSYWDVTTSVISDDTPSTSPGAGYTTAQLQTPTDYTGIYSAWNVNIDTGPAEPWYFGTSTQYPRPKYGRTLTQLLDFYDESPPAATVDYDGNDNGLIDIRTLAQLDAVRYDLDGSGGADLTGNALINYQLAFPGFMPGMGCPQPAGCTGYELLADLDFSGTQWTEIGGAGLGSVNGHSGGAGRGWAPIGARTGYAAAGNYAGDFQGNGHTIRNLYINANNQPQVGLFRALDGGAYSGIGLVDADVTSAYGSTGAEVSTGALVGILDADLRTSYATGKVTYQGSGATAHGRTGGLIGATAAQASASESIALSGLWSGVAVTSNSTSTETTVGHDYAGVLIGELADHADLTASYADGAGASPSGRTRLAGLVGSASSDASITASYAAGPLTRGGAVDANNNFTAPLDSSNTATIVTNSYYDTGVMGTFTGASGTAKTTAELQTPATYGASSSDTFYEWNVDIDNADGNDDITDGVDDPWEFGADSEYPILKFGYNAAAQTLQRPTGYDADADGLIEITTAAQLNLVRHDLDADGWVASVARTAYRTAFPNSARTMGCPRATGCTGYELMADLDLSAYAAGAGWTPLGVASDGTATAYTGNFDGNNHTVSNLTINLTTSTDTGGSRLGLFGVVSGSGVLRDVGLVNPGITSARSGGAATAANHGYVGALAGAVADRPVSGSWVDGGTITVTQSTSDTESHVGCLVGNSAVAISDSWAGCAVSVTDGADDAAAKVYAGGLVGRTTANIDRSYATGAVTVTIADAAPHCHAGGLVGETTENITSSYAAGAVTATCANIANGYAGGLAALVSTGDVKSSFATGNVEATSAGYVGGLVGRAELDTANVVQAAYTTGSVKRTSTSGGGNAGGLIGWLNIGTRTTASVVGAYAISEVDNADTTTPGAKGGLVGGSSSSTTVNDGHWNSDDVADGGTGIAAGATNSAGCWNRCTGQTGAVLKQTMLGTMSTDTVYNDAGWDIDLDGDSNADEPWDFGTATQYPILTFGHNIRNIQTQRGLTAGAADYDANDNNLIDIGAGVAGLHQLDAIRHDTAGRGDAGVTGPGAVAYLAAFPNLLYGMGCPSGCEGYELTADLDFDDNGDGAVDGDDEYGNWIPISDYATTFDGQGHTIANLTIDNSIDNAWVGLFAGLSGADTVVRSLGLLNPNIEATGVEPIVGSLVGQLAGGAAIYAVYVRGGSVTTTGADASVGGLVGDLDGAGTSLRASYNYRAAVVANGTGTHAAGLVSSLTNGGNITASYAAASVANANTNTIASGQSEGGVTGYLATGGGTVVNSYWDTSITGSPTSSGGAGAGAAVGYATTDLQTPEDYGSSTPPPASIYANWNVDLDGDGNADDPWDFGAAEQYPVLKFGYTAAGIAAQRPLDYDDNDNGLIEITTPAQLDAVRYDLQGDGAAAAADRATYRAAFAHAEIGMGCPTADGCSGYELKANIDLSAYPNWDPIGGSYAATFNGEGYAISNLRITDAGKNSVGLFSNLGNAAVVEKVALVDVDIAESWAAGDPALSLINAGALTGVNQGTIRYSYATGRIGVTVTDTASSAPPVQAGGLVGSLFDRGVIAGSWADVAVTVTSSSGHGSDDLVGGLVGRQTGQSGVEASYIVASYAKGAVTTNRESTAAGGLVGRLAAGAANVRASYSIGSVAAHASADTGGLVGDNSGTVTDSYFDFEAAGFPAGTLGKSTSDLKGAAGYTGDYSGWNVDVDNDDDGGYGTGANGVLAGVDNPWYFGTNTEYPILQFKYNASSISRQQGVLPVNSYDTNGNDLIEVSSLAQLNAIRWDVDGNGMVDMTSDIASYLGAFRGPLPGMGCPNGCEGYELVADLDFDTGTAGDRTDDEYYGASGAGWAPIAPANNAGYTAKFVGNGHTIANLYINYTTGSRSYHGLFGNIGTAAAAGEVSGVGLPNASVTVATSPVIIGTLAGRVRAGTVTASWATGSVTSTDSGTGSSKVLGGLAGQIREANTVVRGSWAAVTVTADAAADLVRGGGLLGRVTENAAVRASYATGAVSGGQASSSHNGGLVGQMEGATARIDGSYATGAVSVGTGGSAGGLVATVSTGTVNNDSYWDTTVWAGSSTDGAGQTRSALQSTDGYTGIYATWDDYDVDGETGADTPWDFLAANQYPILTLGHSAASIAAQTSPQNTELLNIAKPANVDEVVRVGDAWTLEIQPTVVSVDLPRTAFTVRSTASDAVAVTNIDPLPGDGTPDAWTPADYTGGNTMIGLTPALSEEQSVVTVRVTSPNGLSTQDYMVTVLRIFCPKAEITGPANMVGEGGSADFTILVCGTTTEPVIVSWAVDTAASTADGADLGRALTGTITVPTGDDREATLSFPITDDDTPEPSETITVRITGVSGGTTRIDMRPAMATIALSDPSLNLRAPDGTGTGGAGDTADAPLTASSILVLTEGAGRSYSLRLATDPRESVTIVIHSNHEGVTTTPDRVTFNAGNWQTPQRVTVNAAPDGDDNHDRATLTHILTDEDGGLLEIIDRIPLFVTDTDPPDDDDIC